MVKTARNVAPSISVDSDEPLVDWSKTVAETVLRVQQLQVEVLASWQQSMAAFNQELWDEWVAHWGGGVPIEP
jgi:hypothetical protein